MTSRRDFLRGRIGRGTPAPGEGVAEVDARCVAGKGVECRICGEHCDAGAIRFSPRPGGPPLPEVRREACTGCGDCVAPCPVQAIRLVAA